MLYEVITDAVVDEQSFPPSEADIRDPRDRNEEEDGREPNAK